MSQYNFRQVLAPLLALPLLSAQLILIFRGVEHFGKWVNPVLLLGTNILVVLFFFKQHYGREEFIQPVANKLHSFVPFLLSIVCCAYICFQYRTGFRLYNTPETNSDVIPQLEALMTRFSKGEQPYYPVQFKGYAAYPVYMPAHWLPIAITQWLGYDTRWVGLLMLLVSYLLFVWFYVCRQSNIASQIMMVLFIPVILYSYGKWGERDLFVSFETPVAAYYLLLAIGLVLRRFWLVVLGITLCLLSRYTFVFWLPLFTIILLHEKPFSQNLKAWLIVAGSIVIFYVIPFLARQPDILSQGIKYHNGAAVGEWDMGAWSFESGSYFAHHFRAFFSGSTEEKVFKTRIVQGSLMILLNIAGYMGYRGLRNKINYYDYSLVTLFLTIVLFYAFGPLTYRYYLLLPLVLGAVILSRAISLKRYIQQ